MDYALAGFAQFIVIGGIWLIIELTWPLRLLGDVAKPFIPALMLIIGIITTSFCLYKLGWIF